MGSSCSCIKSNEPQTELQVDAVRMKEICKNLKGLHDYLTTQKYFKVND